MPLFTHLDCEKREISSDLQLESLTQFLSHRVELSGTQCAEFALELGSRNGMDLLKLERTFFEERLRNREFPRIAAQRCRVGQHRDESEFVVGRPVGEQQTGAGLGGKPQVNHPNLTAIWTRHPGPPT